MRIEKLELKATKQFSSILLNYLEKKELLKPFYQHFPTYENFVKQIEQKAFTSDQRQILFDAMEEQYTGFDPDEAIIENIKKIREANTFTITTGHQLNIFTGPLYFHYKIITTINLCRELNSTHPEYNFVPVFWMATEDHDFEEISSVLIGGKKITWETNQKGPVGKLDPVSIKSALGQVPADISLFRESYLNQPTLAAAVRQYVTELYGKNGLVIVDGDDKNLKGQVTNLIKDDCLKHSVNTLAEKTSSELENLGFKQQVFPREINFFFLKNNFRGRIVKEIDRYKVLDSEENWSKEELEALIEREPWKFSPNVLLRPLYQETILPNLAYIGGPAEVAYWLQMKSSFDHYKIPFPLIIPRNFALIINKEVNRKLAKSGVEINDLFSGKEFITKRLVKKNSKNDLSTTIEKESIVELWEPLTERLKAIDSTLESTSKAFLETTLKKLEKLEKKMMRAEKRKQATLVERIDWIFSTLFPNGGLQERNDNFLSFVAEMPELLDDLIQSLEPLDFRFHILVEE